MLFVGASGGFSVSSISAPGGVQAGDLLIGITAQNSGSIGSPWTVLGTTSFDDALAYKIATGSSDNLAGTNLAGWVGAYRGVGAPTAYSLTFYGTSHSVVGASVTGAGMVIAVCASHGGTAPGVDTTIAAGAGWTQDYTGILDSLSPTDPWPGLFEHKAASGSVTPTATGSGGTLGWGGGVAALAVPLLGGGGGMLL